MRNAETVLSIIRERGRRELPIEDVYRQLFNPDLYLRAYGRIYRNDGAMTSGTSAETVDGMSQEKIKKLIEEIRYERWRWTPVRRTYIPKKKKGKRRPLGLPTWSDKLLQEVMRSLLEAYFEPQFSDLSHGFRPHRGCHTALRVIQRWRGVNWFIEGDIEGCYDNIDHDILLSILREKIHDNRFIRLTENLLKAGYVEDWTYNPTLSGAPQGGIISPILSNIYLDRLDAFVENELIPRFTKGEKRKDNPAYCAVRKKMIRCRKAGNKVAAKALRQEMRKLPSVAPDDPDFRRLRYARYADDFLLGFSGPKEEAREIKALLQEFLRKELKLELSEDKTLITHAHTGKARFLGYEINRTYENSKLDRRGWRSVNGGIKLRVPKDVVRERCNLYKENGKATPRTELIDDDDFSIVVIYQGQYRGFVQYYALAHHIHSLGQLRWVMQTSLFRTLARKYNVSVNKIARRYKSTVQTSEGPRRCYEVRREQEGKKPLIARFGGIPLKRHRTAEIQDQPTIPPYRTGTVEVIQRLVANTCELCGSTAECEVHHIRKLSDVKGKGRKEKPRWVQIMAARRRKTLVVCRKCHHTIHAGKMDLNKTSEG